MAIWEEVSPAELSNLKGIDAFPSGKSGTFIANARTGADVASPEKYKGVKEAPLRNVLEGADGAVESGVIGKTLDGAASFGKMVEIGGLAIASVSVASVVNRMDNEADHSANIWASNAPEHQVELNPMSDVHAARSSLMVGLQKAVDEMGISLASVESLAASTDLARLRETFYGVAEVNVRDDFGVFSDPTIGNPEAEKYAAFKAVAAANQTSLG